MACALARSPVSHDELRRLFGAIDISRQRPVQLDADTLRALLLVLYGAGLRFGEAQRLTLDDADLADAVLTIRNTKFYKKVDQRQRAVGGDRHHQRRLRRAKRLRPSVSQNAQRIVSAAYSTA